MKKLYYTIHPNYHCRELHIYEIVDNVPVLFEEATGETYEDSEDEDKANIQKHLAEEKGLAESDYTLTLL